MRKYLLNTSIIGAVFSSWGIIKSTKDGPRDWRLALLWASWVISLALAVGTVAEDASIERKKSGK